MSSNLRTDEVPQAGVRGGPGRAFVIELVGTPGAGKTTIAHELTRQLEDPSIRVTTFVDAARLHAARTGPGRMIVRLAPRRLKRPIRRVQATPCRWLPIEIAGMLIRWRSS